MHPVHVGVVVVVLLVEKFPQTMRRFTGHPRLVYKITLNEENGGFILRHHVLQKRVCRRL